jgi:hypothetical protein
MTKKGIVRRRPKGGDKAPTDKRGHLKPPSKPSKKK